MLKEKSTYLKTLREAIRTKNRTSVSRKVLQNFISK